MREDIIKLLTVSKFIDTWKISEEQYNQYFDRVTAALLLVNPTLDVDKLRDTFLAKMNDIDSFLDVLVPVYEKHLTKEMLDAVLAFYETEQGQKYLEILPQLNRELDQASRNWSSNIATQILSSLNPNREYN